MFLRGPLCFLYSFAFCFPLSCRRIHPLTLCFFLRGGSTRKCNMAGDILCCTHRWYPCKWAGRKGGWWDYREGDWEADLLYHAHRWHQQQAHLQFHDGPDHGFSYSLTLFQERWQAQVSTARRCSSLPYQHILVPKNIDLTLCLLGGQPKQGMRTCIAPQQSK